MKTFKLFTGVSLFFVIGFAAAATGLVGSCGGDDKPSESEYRDVCKQFCGKTKECNPAAAAFFGDCTAFCTPKPGTTTNQSGEGCSNGAAILAGYKGCLAKSCTELEVCFDMVPDCQGGGSTTTPGTGGTTTTPGLGGATGTTPGTGGRTGSSDAGTTPATDAGGMAGCEDCVKAQMCLQATLGDAGLPGTGTQNFATSCAMATGAARDQVVMLCKATVMNIPGCR